MRLKSPHSWGIEMTENKPHQRSLKLSWLAVTKVPFFSYQIIHFGRDHLPIFPPAPFVLEPSLDSIENKVMSV